MSVINYIARVDVATGVINSVDFYAAKNWPDEGIVEGSGPLEEILWIDEENWSGKSSQEIVEEWYRKDNAWHCRGARPNNYYDWNTETCMWELNSENLWAVIKQMRLEKLQLSDWTQLPDTVGHEKQLEWGRYRQVLRDIPDTFSHITDIEEIIWPTPPD